jgi:Cu(I)/Ag(I) efflux system membrane fusion protein
MNGRPWTAILFVIAALAAGAARAHGDPAAFAVAAAEPRRTTPLTVPAAAQGLIGVEPARRTVPGKWLHCYGQVVPAPDAVVDVNAYVSGEIRRIFVRPGDRVRAGAPLMAIYSPEYISTQRGQLALYGNKERLEILREEGRLPNYLKDAEDNLKWWGMSATQIAALMERGEVSEEIELKAPADGVVTDLFVQPGSIINAGDKTMNAFLVTGKSVARIVSDKAAYWIEGSLLPDQSAMIRANPVVRIDLGAGTIVERRLTKVLPSVDARSQRSRFLVDLRQPVAGLALGRVVPLAVQLDAPGGVWLSRDAVLGQGLAPAVYVRSDASHFERRAVEVLDETPEALRIGGVREGEQVVVAGKMILEGLFRMSAPDGAAGRPHRHEH